MKLYTSYWAQVRAFPKNLVGLNTTVWPPKWRKLGQDNRGIWVINCPPLVPGHNCDGLCNGKCNPKHPQDCEFLKQYTKQLEAINFDAFAHKLQKLHDIISEDAKEDIDFAFIFFEKYDNPCSERWVVQEWLKNHNVKVEEWNQ